MCVHFDFAKKSEEQNALGWAKSVARATAVAGSFDAPPSAWPRSMMPVVVNGEQREVVAMRWGVWPFYSRGKPQYVSNARDDGLLTKSIWKSSALKRRCLIPASAFYEWIGPKGGKWEVRFSIPTRPFFFFAGVWDRDPEGADRGFSMVTTRPNPMIAEIHDRMPVILTDEGALEWMGDLTPEQILALCAPYTVEPINRVDQPLPPKITRADLAPAPALDDLFPS